MPTLQQKLVEQFLEKLSESKNMDKDRIEQLCGLLTDSKKLKAEDLIKVFSLPPGGDLK